MSLDIGCGHQYLFCPCCGHKFVDKEKMVFVEKVAVRNCLYSSANVCITCAKKLGQYYDCNGLVSGD